MLTKEEIRIRDPFILVDRDTETYYMYGTTDENTWEGKGSGFNAYKSKDLLEWDGPFSVFKPNELFWADRHFWAPEVYYYRNNYYMFASFKSEDKRRGTQVLTANDPLGPFEPLTEKPVTPREWECLDGTLYVDHNNDPWMVFCHEWIQVKDGEICAIKLSEDLTTSIGEPKILFRASEAKWPARNTQYVTDGPFLFRNKKDELLMIWSSMGAKGYAMGISKSLTGNVLGPWEHEEDAFFDENGGHGMLFETLDRELRLAIHAPNNMPNERPVFLNIKEENGSLKLI
ncbi:glycoside hydrolase family 43 protein [Salipaludibacillus sp. HK11]|uniref:glycoside hydrolase family 43 protein n=1 Tax=Salipaludibacillus sp. HK11 TaxID=3394320 RepID=UPI0039FD1C59